VAEQVIVVGAALSAAVLFRAVRLRDAPEPRTSAARTRFALPAPWALALGILAAMVLPGVSKVFLAHGRYISSVDPRDQYPYVSEGAASTVAVHINPEGYRNFHVSGRVEATNNPNDLRTERLIGHLSGMPVANPEAVLVVGLGGGITAGTLSLYPEVKRIVICEIEPRVVGAAKQFAPENYSVLSDPRVEIVFDDARHFLATTREKFDVITSDPIHPWVRGNSILFSREYYNIVKNRLKPAKWPSRSRCARSWTRFRMAPCGTRPSTAAGTMSSWWVAWIRSTSTSRRFSTASTRIRAWRNRSRMSGSRTPSTSWPTTPRAART
jgi:spermidine synthase